MANMVSTPPLAAPDKNPMAAAIAAITARAGVTESKVVCDVHTAARDMLDTQGHVSATVVEFRWGRLVVEAPPAAAVLLRYDTDVMLDQLERVAPGEVTELVVRTAR